MENTDTITLIIEQESVICSKSELLRESSYFKVMFSSNFIEKNRSKVELKGVSVKNFRVVLEIMKNNESQLNRMYINEKFSIFITANMFQFQNVERRCEEAIIKSVYVDNVFEGWQFAERFYLENLLIRARFIAVTEFEAARKTSGFLQLDSKLLFRFLANKALICDRELSVFEAGMMWIENNDSENAESLIYTLLTCLDVGELSEDDIMEIKNNIIVQKFPSLVAVLQYIVDMNVKKDVCCDFSSDVMEKAVILMQSERRIEDGFLSFTVCYCITDNKGRSDCDYFVPVFNGNTLNFSVGGYEWNEHGTKGQIAFAYKHIVYFCNLATRCMFSFDAITCTYQRRIDVPFSKSSFKMVACGKIIYFVSGYFCGYWSGRNKSVVYYDCEKNEWSEITLLPKDCQLQNIMCCNYNKRLFLMVVKTKSPKGYFFTHENSEWKPVKVFLNTIIFDQISCNIMFSYNNSLFVKGKALTEFIYSNDRIFMQKHTEEVTKVNSCVILDYCLCNQTVSTLYAIRDERLLEVFCLDTRMTKLTVLPNGSQHLFTFRDPETLCKSEQYINEYFKSVC